MTDVATVVHLFGTLDRGGAETVALGLCQAVPPDEFAQIFLTLGDREGRLADRFRQAGADVERCPLYPMWTFVPRLWRRLRALRPRVVVSHVSLVSGLTLAVAAAARVPVRIAHMHSEGDGRRDTSRRRLQRLLLRRLLRHTATAVVGVTSGAVAFSHPRAGDERYRVLPNGFDIERFASARDRCCPGGGPPTLTHIGRAASEKNRGFLLHVHAEARRLRPGTTLRFVGPGGTADLEAVDPGCVDNPLVSVEGETDNVEAVLASCDVLLLPSHREGLPGVVLQALAAGVPVLGADLPGLRDVAGQVEGVMILPLSAGAKAWARAALWLADLPAADRDEISESMRDSPYSLERYAARWRTLWTAC